MSSGKEVRDVLKVQLGESTPVELRGDRVRVVVTIRQRSQAVAILRNWCREVEQKGEVIALGSEPTYAIEGEL